MSDFTEYIEKTCSQENFENIKNKIEKNNNWFPRYSGYLMEYISCFYFMYLKDKYTERALSGKIYFTETESKGVKKLKLLEKIFSVKNEYSNDKKYKVISLLGIKIKLKIDSKKNFEEYPKKSYSQFGEDIIIKNLLMLLKNSKLISDINYIDIGCNHPIKGSNTYSLYIDGIRGILIDANPFACKNCHKIRNEDIIINSIITTDNTTEKKMSFYIFSETSGLNTYSESSRDEVLKLFPGFKKTMKEIEIKTVSINKIVKENFIDKKKYPIFIDLDVEGVEMDILKSWDFSLSKPIVWCIETAGIMTCCSLAKKNQEIITYMLNNGYVIYADTYANTIFIEKNAYNKLTREKDNNV